MNFPNNLRFLCCKGTLSYYVRPIISERADGRRSARHSHGASVQSTVITTTFHLMFLSERKIPLQKKRYPCNWKTLGKKLLSQLHYKLCPSCMSEYSKYLILFNWAYFTQDQNLLKYNFWLCSEF